MTRHNLALFAAAWACGILAACTTSTSADPGADVLPDVPRSTRLSELTLADWTEFCEWQFQEAGGSTGRPCAAGGPLRREIDGCLREYEVFDPESPAYLGAALQCMNEFVRACDTTGVLGQPRICLEASSTPPAAP